MEEKIAPGSTVADVVRSLANPVEYVRQILWNFVEGQYDRDAAVVRIGVAGIGVASNYKIEYQETIDLVGNPTPMRAAQIYHGRSHRKIEAYANQDTRDEHWSTRSMSFAEISALLADLRKEDGLMPRGPKCEKRTADVIGAAVMVGKIARGEIEDITTEDGKNAAAVSLGRMGGKARAEGMTAKRRKEIAKKAASSRWGKARAARVKKEPA